MCKLPWRGAAFGLCCVRQTIHRNPQRLADIGRAGASFGGAAKLRGRHRHAAAGKTISIDKLVAWLGISLDEFPAWACAHLESELASINELARMFRDNEEPAALVRQIDDPVAELKRLILYWTKR